MFDKNTYITRRARLAKEVGDGVLLFLGNQLVGIVQVDPDINDRLEALLANAKEKDLWWNTYRLTDIAEYWAEGVQDWFNVNAEMDHPDGKHNYVNTREELKERDPGLYDLLAEYFPATDQQISKHKFVNECTKENSRTH